MLFFACFSVVVHTVSIWLTVTLAVFRYIFIKFPRKGQVSLSGCDAVRQSFQWKVLKLLEVAFSTGSGFLHRK